MIPRLQFLEQAHVFDGDDGLASESLQELDLLVRERAHFGAANHDSPNGDSLAQQRGGQYGAMSRTSLKAQTFRKLGFSLCRHIVNVDRSSVNHGATIH